MLAGGCRHIIAPRANLPQCGCKAASVRNGPTSRHMSAFRSKSLWSGCRERRVVCACNPAAANVRCRWCIAAAGEGRTATGNLTQHHRFGDGVSGQAVGTASAPMASPAANSPGYRRFTASTRCRPCGSAHWRDFHWRRIEVDVVSDDDRSPAQTHPPARRCRCVQSSKSAAAQ